MSDFRYFKTHRTWEDWAGMLLGMAIILSPWFPTQASHEVVDAERSYVILNTFTVGMLVPSSNMSHCSAGRRWPQFSSRCG
jgi:hypothetical protein